MHSLTSKKELKNIIQKKSKEFGFDIMRVTDPKINKEDNIYMKEFLDKNYHGDMDWLKKNIERRMSPKKIWEDTKSIIILGVNYGPDHNPMKNLESKEIGNISVYARGNDYHDIIKKNLKQFGRWIVSETNSEIKVFIDTAPIMEKPLAQRAGLGWQGKHTNLVSKKYGSWLFLASIFTNLNLEIDKEEEDHCGSCNNCLEICPTNAFVRPYKLDARKCISYLTIEHKGIIPNELRSKIGNRIYGCDDCLAVCPWNKFAKESSEIKFKQKNPTNFYELKNLSLLDDSKFRKIFSKSPIKRIGRNRFLRNVLLAIGNSKLKDLKNQVNKNLLDDSPLVRGAAVWALNQLVDGEELKKTKIKMLSIEKNEAVRKEWIEK